MKLLLRLYPGWWRRRYGAEALDILESRPVTPSVFWNVVIGAVDAWLNQGMPPNSAGDTNQRESEGGYLMTGNRKRNKRVASVLALVGLMALVGAVVFVETYRTIQGHPDGASSPINALVGYPFVVFPIATAGMGLWVLLTGRRLRDWPRWPFEGRALRLAGAYCLVGDLLVVALAMTRNVGLAFLLGALLALALAATTQVVRSRRPGI
jgi:hypothetical protein